MTPTEREIIKAQVRGLKQQMAALRQQAAQLEKLLEQEAGKK